jgi:protein-S-isoprenylcysteine O-methyltransferase Ste14
LRDAFSLQRFLLSRCSFPVTIPRCRPLNPALREGFELIIPISGPIFSVIFPLTGIFGRDRFAGDCVLRHLPAPSDAIVSGMTKLDNKIPPPIAAAIVAAAMWLVSRVSLVLAIDGRVRFAMAGAFAGFGFCIAAMGMIAFRRARTTINPVKVEEASSIVSSGIYRRTRNPMYVGLTSLLLGWAVYLASPVALLGPLAFVLFTTRFQIIPEERVLTAKFGRVYTDYQQMVRRWL